MKQTIRNWLCAIIFAVAVGGTLNVTLAPQPTYAAACKEYLLTFPAWYRGLLQNASGGNCDVKAPSEDGSPGSITVSAFIWRIVLNIIEMMLQLAGYIAVGFIIFGGYRYMISRGTPDGMVAARKTIVNAVIGLVISIMSIGIVNAIAGAIT